MATVFVNDLTIEPKTPPPRAAAPAPEQSAAPPKSAAQMEHDLETLQSRRHERALRLWAH